MWLPWHARSMTAASGRTWWALARLVSERTREPMDQSRIVRSISLVYGAMPSLVRAPRGKPSVRGGGTEASLTLVRRAQVTALQASFGVGRSGPDRPGAAGTQRSDHAQPWLFVAVANAAPAARSWSDDRGDAPIRLSARRRPCLAAGKSGGRGAKIPWPLPDVPHAPLLEKRSRHWRLRASAAPQHRMSALARWSLCR